MLEFKAESRDWAVRHYVTVDLGRWYDFHECAAMQGKRVKINGAEWTVRAVERLPLHPKPYMARLEVE